ncbi:TPA: hypothetical protein EYP44_05580 [Candidatus Bathyarchaeota archaeon]|nr:hypothetical protein [Candidatus Bathyarchaeota archaeon]
MGRASDLDRLMVEIKRFIAVHGDFSIAVFHCRFCGRFINEECSASPNWVICGRYVAPLYPEKCDGCGLYRRECWSWPDQPACRNMRLRRKRATDALARGASRPGRRGHTRR